MSLVGLAAWQGLVPTTIEVLPVRGQVACMLQSARAVRPAIRLGGVGRHVACLCRVALWASWLWKAGCGGHRGLCVKGPVQAATAVSVQHLSSTNEDSET